MDLIPPPLDRSTALRARWPKIRQAIQTTVAAVVAYAIATFLALPQGYWAVMTAILVVQASVGASLGLAVDRLLATLLGAAVGGALVGLFGTAPATIALLLALSVGGLTYLATVRSSLRLAPVSAAIVILGDLQFGSPLSSAANRVLEIGVGAVIAVLVSLFIFPSRAGQSLSAKAGSILPTFAEHWRGTVDAALGVERPDADFIALNAKVRVALGAAETLVQEARREIAGHIADHADPAAVVRTMRRLWYTQMMAARAARKPLPPLARDLLSPSLVTLRDTASLAIEGLGAAYRGEAALPDMASVEGALAGFNAAIFSLRQSGIMKEMATDEVAQIFSLSFALSQIGQNLQDLADRHVDLHRSAQA